MKRWICAAVCAAMLLVSLTGCSTVKKLEGGQPDAPVVKTGELAARQGDWVYYINGSNSADEEYDFTYGAAIRGALCRINPDRSQKDIVIPQVVISFTIRGEWIYYMTPKGDDVETRKLMYCRARIDGTGFHEIADITDYSYFNMHEEYVYFTLNEKFYRADHNLADRKEIIGSLIHNAVFAGDDIYYTTAHYDVAQDVYYPTELRTVKNDGTNDRLIAQGAFYLIGTTDKYLAATNAANGYTVLVDRSTLVSETRLYVPYETVTVSDDGRYLLLNDIEDGKTLRAYNIEARESVTLFSDGARLPILCGDTVYFYNDDDDNKIYSVPVDGSAEAALYYRYPCSPELSLQVLDNYMYFFNAEDAGAIYRINMNTGVHEYIEMVRANLS